MVICLEGDADLHVAQLLPLPLTVSCFSKIQIGFTFLVLADLGSPGKRAVKRVCVLYDWPFPQVYFAKNVANIIFPYNFWLSFQHLCHLLWGYHFHFVDSNRGSTNSVISVPSWHVLLFWPPRRGQLPGLGLLKDGLFQFSTFGSAENVYSELQATKTAP